MHSDGVKTVPMGQLLSSNLLCGSQLSESTLPSLNHGLNHGCPAYNGCGSQGLFTQGAFFFFLYEFYLGRGHSSPALKVPDLSLASPGRIGKETLENCCG